MAISTNKFVNNGCVEKWWKFLVYKFDLIVRFCSLGNVIHRSSF